MKQDIIRRFSIPFREAMAALLAEDQVDAESYEIRVIGQCVVIDLVNPVVMHGIDGNAAPPFDAPPAGRRMPATKEEATALVAAALGSLVSEGRIEIPDEDPPAEESQGDGQTESQQLQDMAGDKVDDDDQIDAAIAAAEEEEAGEEELTEEQEKERERLAAIEAGQNEMFYQSSEPKADAEKPKEKRERTETQKVADKTRSTRAAILCGEQGFQRFMDEEGSEEGTAHAVRLTCGVQSRRELDTDEKAGREWDKLMKDFDHWLKYPD